MYGKTITNKEKHRIIKYLFGSRKASNSVKSQLFHSLDEIDDDFYEVSSLKREILMNVPVTIGFTILQYAKLRMLQFYYDFMDRYL